MGDYTRRAFLGKSAALAGALAGAGSATAVARAATGAHTAAKALTGTLNVWIHQSPAYQQVYTQTVNAFKKLHPGVTINTLAIPYAQFESKALIAFTSGSPPDIIKLGGWDIANYASKGLIAPVDPSAVGYSSLNAFKGAYAPGSLNSVTYGGKVYGLPIDYNSIFMFYRRDHFEAAGLDPDKPPTTWEQAAEYALKLTKRSGSHLKRAGWTYWYNLPIWDFLNFLALPTGLGGGLVNSKNQGILSDAAGIKALTWYGDLSTKLKVSSPSFTNPNFNYGQIADGTASMTVSGNFAVALIESLGKIKLGKEFDVAPMPQWADAKQKVTSGYSWAWLVAQASKNQALAWEFLNFLDGGVAHVNSILSVSDLIVPVKGWQSYSVAKASKGTQIVAEEISYTNYGPTLAQWTQMAQQLSDNLVALALGEKTPAQAASAFDSSMANIH